MNDCIHEIFIIYLAVIYVKVGNNRADTVLDFLKLGVESFNLPSRVRGDRGMENGAAGDFMIASHGTGRGSFIVGRSVHIPVSTTKESKGCVVRATGLLHTSSKHCSETWN